MKKLFKFSLLLTLVCVAFTSCKDDDDAAGPTIDYSGLPKRAQNFVSQHFGINSYRSIEEVTTEEDVVSGYNVELAGNVQVQFDKEGTWQLIEGNGKVLPGSILLQYMPSISTYVEENYPGKGVVRYDRKFYGMKLSLENGDELSVVLTGDVLGVNKTMEELPASARELLNTHFTPLEAEVSIFESGADEATVYTAQYRNGYQVRFNAEGNWLSIKGDSVTQLLPETIGAILPGQATQVLDTYIGGDIASISRATASSSINVGEVTEKEVNGILTKVTTLSTFDAEGNWLALEDTSGLPVTITGLLPENAKNLLAQHQPNKTDFASIRKTTQKFGLEMIDIITLTFKQGDKYAFQGDGNWFSFDGILPKEIKTILPAKIQSFLTDYYTRTTDRGNTITQMNKEARLTIYTATADTTVTYFTRIAFQDNSWLTFSDADDEWAQIIANDLTSAESEKLLSLLPFESQMYLSITFGSMDPKPLLNKIEKITVTITTNTGTEEEPVLVENRYGVYRISYFGGSWVQFNVSDGAWRTVQAANNTTPLPQSVKDLFPQELKDYIAAKGWDLSTASISYVNKLFDTIYELRFVLDDGTQTFVRYDLTVDPNLPEEEEPAE
jgi:cation transport regulator ChaB